MIVNLENPKESSKKLPELRREFGKGDGSKTTKNQNKTSVAFCYSGNKNRKGRDPFKTVKKKPL